MKFKNIAKLVVALTLFGNPLRGQEVRQEQTEGEVTYESAVENPKLRPVYVSDIFKKINVPPYVKKIEYDPDPNSDPKNTAIMQNNVSTVFRGDHLDRADSQISIMPLIFSKDPRANRVHSDAEFKFVLINHEFKHAELYNNEGRPIIQDCVFNGILDTKLFKILSELEAKNNEALMLWEVNEKGLVRKLQNEELSRDYAISTLNASVEEHDILRAYAEETENPKIDELVEKYNLPHYRFRKK